MSILRILKLQAAKEIRDKVFNARFEDIGDLIRCRLKVMERGSRANAGI